MRPKTSKEITEHGLVGIALVTSAFCASVVLIGPHLGNAVQNNAVALK